MAQNRPGLYVRPARPDLATILGLVLAIGSILGGLILEGGSLRDVRQLTAAMIVLGGTLGAVMVATPLEVCKAAFQRLLSVLLHRAHPVAATLDSIVHFAERARRNGLASLEDEASNVDDPFLAKALNLAVDGTEIAEIRSMMLLDLQMEEERAEAIAKVWEAAAGYAPTIGIIGAVLGLIQVMKNLQNLDEVGRGIAVAFVATVYGVASANLLFLPAASKLRARDRRLFQMREMVVEGVVAIAEGMNPKLIRLKLEAFVPVAQPLKARSGAVRMHAAQVATNKS